jgi:dolichyl-diphosphooligosaccharide--protein glycosyltransferase
MKLEDIQAKITIDELKKHRIWAVLTGIFLIGFSIRYITHHELLFDPDSYWWYRLAEYFAGIKTEHFVREGDKLIDQLAYYPTGRNVYGELLGLPLFIGYSYKILSTLGLNGELDLMHYMFIVGPFFGASTVVASFFLVRELTNTRVACLSALFYSFISSSFTRNTAGDTGQESLGGLLIFTWMYLFLRATKEEPLSKRQLAYSLGSGILFGVAFNSWGGNIFYFSLISSSVLVYVAYKTLRQDYHGLENVSAAFAVMMTVGLLSSHFIGPLRYPLFSLWLPYLLSYFAILSCAAVAVSLRREELNPTHLFLGIVALAFLVALVTGKLQIIMETSSKFLHGIITGEKGGETGPTVAYYRATSLEEFKQTFGILLAAIPFGVAYFFYDFYRNRDFKPIFLAMWLFLGILAFKYMVRLSYFLALILPVTAFLLLDLAFSTRKAEVSKKGKRVVKASSSNLPFRGVILGAIILFLMVPHLNTGISYASSAKYNDGSVNPWRDVGQWLKANTPEDSLLFHWWDYGYHLQTFAERRTIVDGGNVGPQIPGGSRNRNVDVAKMFTSPEDEASKIIDLYNPEDRPVYVLVSYEEFGKSGAINFHVRDQLFITSFSIPKTGNAEQDQKTLTDILTRNQINTYYVVNLGNSYLVWALIQVDERGNYHPEWSEKLLAKLLPFNTGYGQGLKHFQMVYQNGYVYVYKYIK